MSMALMTIKIMAIVAFSYIVLLFYKKQYARGYADGISDGNITALPHGCVRVVLELPPHLHSKFIAHLTQYELTDYVNDEFNFVISANDVKIFADFAYKHSLGISVKSEPA